MNTITSILLTIQESDLSGNAIMGISSVALLLGWCFVCREMWAAKDSTKP